MRLVESTIPLPPGTYVTPEYPPVARVTLIEGRVSFNIEVNQNGGAENLVFESGHSLLQPAVKDAVGKWHFPKESEGQQIHITLEFALNCPPQK